MFLSSSLCHPRSRATKLSSSPLYALPLGPAHSSFQVQQQKRLSFELAALLVASLGLGSLASVSSAAATALELARVQLVVPPSLEPLHRIGRDKAEAGCRAANGRGGTEDSDNSFGRARERRLKDDVAVSCRIRC